MCPTYKFTQTKKDIFTVDRAKKGHHRAKKSTKLISIHTSMYINMMFLLSFPLPFLFLLHRLVSRAEILGNSEVFIKSGNDINLTCVAYEAPGPPSFIYWYKGPSVINYSQRGGISVLTERHSKTSKLVISRAMASDSGNYTCLPSNSGE